MRSESEPQVSVKISIYSIIGALLGGITGSWASTAFGETAAFDLITTFLIFIFGAFLGILIGTAFHNHVSHRFSRRAAKRVEWTGRTGIAFIGFLIIILPGNFLIVLSTDGEFRTPDIPEFILALAVYAIGVSIIFLALHPILVDSGD